MLQPVTSLRTKLQTNAGNARKKNEGESTDYKSTFQDTLSLDAHMCT